MTDALIDRKELERLATTMENASALPEDRQRIARVLRSLAKSENEMASELERASVAVYLAAEEGPATDISARMRAAAIMLRSSASAVRDEREACAKRIEKARAEEGIGLDVSYLAYLAGLIRARGGS